MKNRLLKTMTIFALIALMVVLLVPAMTFGTSAAETYTWTRVTSVDTLKAGGTFIIGYEASANSGTIIPMANKGSASTSAAGFMYSGASAASGKNDTLDMTSYAAAGDAFVVTIAKSTATEGNITIHTGTGYIGNSNTKNNCKLFAEDTVKNGTSFTATVGNNDVFTLKNANASYHTFSYNTGNPRFACYGGTQKNLVIYQRTVTAVEEPHKHSYGWNGNAGIDGSHTLTCANTDDKCDALTTTEECKWKDGFCSVCGAAAPACAHPTTTEVAEVPATCTEIGYTAGVQCTVCNQYPSGRKELPALGHTEMIDAAVDATCTTAGKTEGKHCSVCNEVLVAQTEVPATGHTYVNGTCGACDEPAPLKYTFDYTTGTNDTVPSDVTEGLVTLTFSKGTGKNDPKWYSSGTAIRFYQNNTLTISTVEGYYIKSITLNFTQGAFDVNSGTVKDGAWTPANNETTSVVFTNINSTQARVDKIFIELAAICKHANTEAIGEAKDANCTEDGITAGEKCSDCGEVLKAQETISATGHTYENGSCTVCGEAQCTEHTWVDGEVTTPATCTATGLQEQYCSVCGQPNPTDKVLPMIDHTVVTDAAVAPTCTATGLTEGSHCSVCSKVLVEQSVVDMVDHNYVDNKCTVCGDIIVTGDNLADFGFDTEDDTYNGEHDDGSAIKADTEFTSGNYTLKFDQYANVYAGAFDAKGNSALKLGTSSKAGSFTFTVPDNVNTVVIYVAGYKTNQAKIDVNGSSCDITTYSNDGVYTKIVVDTSTTKTVSLTTKSGGYRAMINSIEFWGEEAVVDEGIKDTVNGYTVTLGDNIGVNFYMNLTAETLADETAYMLFTLPNGDTVQVFVKDIKNGNTLEYNGETLYRFTATIAVKEMADEVKAQLFTALGNSAEFSHTVQTYAKKVIDGDYTDAEKALAKAMLNYGANAQLLFGYNTDNLANAVLDEADQAIADVTIADNFKMEYTENIAGATFRGTTTMWEADTAIRFYFNITDENVTFTLDGVALEVKENNFGKYVEIDGILAKDMKTSYMIVVSNSAGDEQYIEASVYSYFYEILARSNYSDVQKTAAKAAYIYSQAAIEYISSKQN